MAQAYKPKEFITAQGLVGPAGLRAGLLFPYLIAWRCWTLACTLTYEHHYSCHHLFSSQHCFVEGIYVFVTLNVRVCEINTVYSEYQQLIRGSFSCFQAYPHGGNCGRLGSRRLWKWWGAGNAWQGKQPNGNCGLGAGIGVQDRKKGCIKLWLSRYWKMIGAGGERLDRSRSNLHLPICHKKLAMSISERQKELWKAGLAYAFALYLYIYLLRDSCHQC